MSCASCVGKVERKLLATPGVATAVVSLILSTADISYHAAEMVGSSHTETLLAAVVAAGFDAKLIKQTSGVGGGGGGGPVTTRLAIEGGL